MDIQQSQAGLLVISKIQNIILERSKYSTQMKIGLVPTMGFLHEGHFSLIRKARSECDIVIVSIFVNPAQFGPSEDLSKYPRNLERDLQMLQKLAVDIVFTPSARDMYPENFATYIEPAGQLANVAEGASRPGHFRGVATVVVKLFNILQPSRAYFGQKDAQQAAIIKRVISDLNLPVELSILPIIREHDGLAMSSRNSYLNPKERQAATTLFKALLEGRKFSGTHPYSPVSSIIETISGVLKTEPLIKADYIQIRHPESFIPLKTMQSPALLLIAAKVGPARLIDNFLLRPDNTWETGIISSSAT